MHLVGFTIEVYYDTRPYERQINSSLYLYVKMLNSVYFLE